MATKEDYAHAIFSHASKSKEEFLFLGVNYRSLSKFLQAPSPSSTVIHSNPYTAPEPWPYLAVHTYGPGGAVSKINFDDPSEAQSFLSTHSVSPEVCQLLFLRGFPSSDWLNTLGALYKVNPEFMRRHLDFLQSPLYYDLPAMPSSSRNIFDLKITTIGTRGSALGISDVQKARQQELEAVRKHQTQLGMNKSIGDSIIRKFSNHDETNFTLEQNMSCYLKNHKGGFVVLIWLDTGKSLEFCSDGPWKQPKNSFIPVIQHRAKGPLKLVNPGLDKPQSSDISTPPSHTFQNASLLATNYGSTLDAEAVPTAPLYALSELFSFASHSESQFLNFINSQVTREVREYECELGPSIENLRYHRSLLEEHVEHISYTLNLIRNGCGSNGTTGKAPLKVVSETLNSLQLDYENLLTRAQSLTARCIYGINGIMENATSEESRKSRSQTEMYGRLSVLAFFWAPLSFATGLFGMNFTELGTGDHSIWLFFVVLVPLLVGSTVLAFPRLIGFGNRKRVDVMPTA
ncbi:hypothetical protein G7Y89_g4663 [Cudoniella acicularis]|uniref:Uncharacterized protein n=1 Tax=Cudoniella acicularis TaxID=354080 RepID=A0A8H4RR18_9HELO|nr:hypothetical protein G7Y89_g4663 [Cudoniella acicularis]